MQDSVLWTGRPVVIGGYRPAVHECEEADFFPERVIKEILASCPSDNQEK
jgi:hypothetical protein